jgi:hypothetical protein
MAVVDVILAGPPGQPDIRYAPDYSKFIERSKRRKAGKKLQRTLPEGFPDELHSDLNWDGESIGNKFNWTHELSVEEVEEIGTALNHFKCMLCPKFIRSHLIVFSANDVAALKLPLGQVNQETFPLPKMKSTLRAISHEIHHGHGFKVLRGLPVGKHTREENIIIYAGVSSHVAPLRGRQDHQFNGEPADVVLSHIVDLSDVTDVSKIGSPAYSTDKQVFHTDSGDVIALICLSEAAEGGQSKLSSSWLVYNELARTRPDLIRTLAEPWPVEM